MSHSPADKRRRRSSRSVRDVEDSDTSEQNQEYPPPSPGLLSPNVDSERLTDDKPSSALAVDGPQPPQTQSYLPNPPFRTSSDIGTAAAAIEADSSHTTSNTARDMDEQHHNNNDGNTDCGDENTSQQANDGPSAASQPSLEQVTATGYSTTAPAGTSLREWRTTIDGQVYDAASQSRDMIAGASSRQKSPHDPTTISSSSQLLISSDNTSNDRHTRPPWLRLWVANQLNQRKEFFPRPNLMSGDTSLLAQRFRAELKIDSLQAISCDVKSKNAAGFGIVLPISRDADAEEVHQIIIEQIHEFHAKETLKDPNIIIHVCMVPVELDVDVF